MDEMAQVPRPRRVLHFLESGGLYGAESVVLNLSREMLKTADYTPVLGCIVQRAGEAVALVDKARDYGIEAHCIVINNKRFPLDILLFNFHLRRLRIDLIHSHGYKASIVGFTARVLLQIPILPTCHLWFWSKDSPLKFRLMTGLEIFLYRYFKAITVVSQPIKQILVEHGVSAERIHIIKNGINLDDFVPLGEDKKARLRNELCIEAGTHVIITLGRLTEQKAHIDIIRAAWIMKNQGRRFVALIVGDGKLREELARQIREYGVEAEVMLLGFRDDARALLQISDVFLLPSLDEGLPIAMLEAMASRVPVIATSVGDVPELLDGGRVGTLINKNDANSIVDSITLVLGNEEYRSAHIHHAYEILAKYYSSSSMFKSYLLLYEN